MKQLNFIFLLLCLSFLANICSAQLVINEISQGPTGTKEYVELVVVSNFNCNPNQQCVDLRGWYLDDNNGYHSTTTSGSGIADGCFQLTQHPIWACVPIGTILLLYNANDIPANIPPLDTSLTDGNCRLVFPIDSMLPGICRFIVKNNFYPNHTNSSYPTTGFTNCPIGPSWNLIAMANGNDSYHTVTPSGNVVHTVGWGNNTLNTNIYFPGSAAGLVFSMENLVDNNPYNQANWTSKSASIAETPGMPNSVANAQWINYLNNNCSSRLPLNVFVSSSNPLCGQCNGTITITASGGFSPYQIKLNGVLQTSSTITGLCNGNYLISITDSIGCEFDSLIVFNVSPSEQLTYSINKNSFCMGDSAQIIVSGSSLLTWQPLTNITRVNDSVFWVKPTTTTTYLFITGNALCGDTVTVPITVYPKPTADAGSTVFLCDGQSAQLQASGGITYSWYPSVGLNNNSINNPIVNTNTTTIYSVFVYDTNGCLDVDTIGVYVANKPTVSISGNSSICQGSSVTLTAQGASNYTWLPVPNFSGSTQNTLLITPIQSTIFTVIGFNYTCSDTAFYNVTVNPLPTVNFNVNNTCQSNNSQLIVLNNPDAFTTYSWFVNQNLSANGTTYLFNTNVCGTYNIKVIGTTTEGCRDSSIKSLNIFCKPTAGFSGLPTTICQNNWIQLQNNTASSTGDTLNYMWLLPYNENSTEINPSFFTSIAGTYSVQLIATTQNGCSDTLKQSVVINPTPVITIKADTVCIGTPVTFTFNGTNIDTSCVFNWNLGDGTTVNYSSGFNYNYNTSQTYVVTLIVTNSAGCSDTTSTNAVVLALPAFNFNTNQTCENSLTQFQVQNVLPGYGFYWDFNNDNNADATGQQVSYTFPQAGNYIVALIQTSAGGCSDTIRKNISINPKPLANLLSAPQSVCEPQCVTLIADTGNLYYWQVNNEIKTGNVTMWCLPPGNYSIKLKAVNSFGCSDSTMFNQYITVYQKPTADFLVINNEADWSAPEIEFQLSNPLPHTVYTVNYGDSTIVNYNNLSSFYHLYNDTGNFLVQVVAINQHQCSDTAYNNVKITPAFSVYIPNAFTPNSDVLNPIFKPICNGIDRNGYLFRIYDRWGCMLFETTNPDEGWDSKYKGKLCPIDHYAYTLRVIDYRGKEREFYGTVTLVR